MTYIIVSVSKCVRITGTYYFTDYVCTCNLKLKSNEYGNASKYPWAYFDIIHDNLKWVFDRSSNSIFSK